MRCYKDFLLFLSLLEILAWVQCFDQQVSKPCIEKMLQNCSCKFNQFDEEISVNCTNPEIVGNKQDLYIAVTVVNLTFNGYFVEKLDGDFIRQCKDGDASLPNLKILDLSRNNISKIDSDFFKCFPNLEKLILNQNTIYFNSTTAPMLGNLKNLKTLELQKAFYAKEKKSFYDKDKGRHVKVLHNTEIQWVFQRVTLPNLETLHLEHNNLWYINTTALCKPLPNLENLHLSYNHIRPSNVHISCFKNLKTLNLDNNAVTHLPEDFIHQLNKSSLTHLNLTENPWLCDCDFTPTVSWLKRDASNFVNNKSTLWCYIERQRRYVVNLEDSELICDYDAEPLDKRLKNSYIVLGCVFAAIGIMFLVVLYLNRDKIFRVGKRCFDPFINYSPNAPRGTYANVAV